MGRDGKLQGLAIDLWPLLLEFAQNTEAHIVLSTNVRALYTRAETPQFCKGCAVIPGLQMFDGFVVLTCHHIRTAKVC